jgi:radical SAM protein with 4Fe4S-binding SPASM domain
LINEIKNFNPVVISPSYDYLFFNEKQYHIPYMKINNKKYISAFSNNSMLKSTMGISQNWYFTGTFKKFITKNLNDIIESNKQYYESIFKFVYSEEKCKQCELQYICITCPFYKKYCNDGLKEWVKYLLKLAEEAINENKN